MILKHNQPWHLQGLDLFRLHVAEKQMIWKFFAVSLVEWIFFRTFAEWNYALRLWRMAKTPVEALDIIEQEISQATIPVESKY